MANCCQSFDSSHDSIWTDGAVGAEGQQAAAQAAQGGLTGEGALVLMTTVKQEGAPSPGSSSKWEGALELAATGGQQQPEEPSHGAQARAQSLPSRRRTRNRFLPWQLEELEKVFEESHYPEALTIHLLAELIEVTESRVKSWFNNRRVKYRKSARAMALGKAPPGFRLHDYVACSRPPAMPSFLHDLFRDGKIPELQIPGPPELPLLPAYP